MYFLTFEKCLCDEIVSVFTFQKSDLYHSIIRLSQIRTRLYFSLRNSDTRTRVDSSFEFETSRVYCIIY